MLKQEMIEFFIDSNYYEMRDCDMEEGEVRSELEKMSKKELKQLLAD